MGVDSGEKGEEGAGDQGLMFGYASDETEAFMPTPILFAHRLTQRLSQARRSGELDWLRPDGKSQVSVEYDGQVPRRIEAVVVSCQHAEDISVAELRPVIIDRVIRPTLPAEMLDDGTKFFVNPTGKFVVGGPQADCGLTGRKIIVDTYGGVGSHGGGAFSGKDPSKVDRSASYMARHVAKNIVASGLAKRAEVQLAYAIGVVDPVSVMVDTYGTGQVSEDRLTKAVREVFDLTPRGIIAYLDLLRPIYKKTAAYGHFGRNDPDFSWESTHRVDDRRPACGG
jgi:S-adenosylmethionine synthetase